MSKLLHEKIAEEFHVSPIVHDEDFLLKWLQQCLPDEETAFRHYFDNGRESALRIKEIILRNQQPKGISTINIDSFSILDFASGFGMVNRHFSHVIPQAQVEACDIHPKAVSFHSQYLQLTCHPSSYDPKKLAIDKTFDVALRCPSSHTCPARAGFPGCNRFAGVSMKADSDLYDPWPVFKCFFDRKIHRQGPRILLLSRL